MDVAKDINGALTAPILEHMGRAQVEESVTAHDCCHQSLC